MDSAARRPSPVVDPLTVGRAFVMQYYDILYNMPEHLYRFYKDISKVGRVGQDGVMRSFTTLDVIIEVLKTLFYGEFKSAEITNYDTQESHNGGFLVVVTGYFTLNERVRKKFTQTFFLAPQENGFFVLNDILRFVDEPEATDWEVVSGKNSETLSHVDAPTGNQGSEVACISVNPFRKEVYLPLSNKNAAVAKENVLVPEIVNEEVPDIEITCKEVADDSLKISDPDVGREDVPKKSYASVLKVAKDKSGVSGSSLLSPKQISKDQYHQVSSDPSPKQIPKDQDHQASSDPSPKQKPKVQDHQVSSVPSPKQIPGDQDHQGSSDPSPVVESDAVSEVVDGTENGQNQGFEALAEGTSIYVKHLPGNATIAMLETEFKQFGAISDGGIQVIYQRAFGYPFGFVEFEEADAAKKAIEASPVMIGGQKVFVEEKKSTSRGNRRSGNEYQTQNVGVRRRPNYGYRRRGGGRGGGGSFNRSRGNEYFANTISTY